MAAMSARKIEATVVQRLAHLRMRHSPSETCGLLLETANRAPIGDPGHRVVRCPNRSTTPRTRFVVHPQDWLRVWRAAERMSGNIVGVWHTHPFSEAWLSPADRATAWPELLQVVAGTDGVRAFARREGRWMVCFEEVWGAEVRA